VNERKRNAALSHVAECPDCAGDRALAARVARVEDLLATAAAPVVGPVVGKDLSHRVLVAAAPHLRAYARRAYARRVAVCLLIASLPLPAMVVYGEYVLGAIYSVLAKVLPATLAGWVVAGYGATAVLLLAATYAAIPVLVDDRAPARAAS